MAIKNSSCEDYHVGGGLPVHSFSYVERPADQQLYLSAQQGTFCYVLNSQQMGKSSLCIRTAHRLQSMGFRLIVLNLAAIVTPEITLEQWYASLLQSIVNSAQLSINVRFWWQHHAHLSPAQRLAVFLDEVLLNEVQQPIILFIDEVDQLLTLNFSVNDFFALIRLYHSDRTASGTGRRLSFILLGTTTPSDLIIDENYAPFDLGQAIALQGFQFSEALPLLSGLQGKVQHPATILRRILSWTNGQPFLTQKLCQLVVDPNKAILKSEDGSREQSAKWVDDLVRSHIIQDWDYQDEPRHLRSIAARLLNNRQHAPRILELYQQVLQSELFSFMPPIMAHPSQEQRQLLLAGLIIEEQGYLKVYNQIYREVFSLEWIEQQFALMRPYGSQLTAWIHSACTDRSYLLQGSALKQAQSWVGNGRLSDWDYRFLAASCAFERLRQRKGLTSIRPN